MGIDRNERDVHPGQLTRGGVKPPSLAAQVAELCELQRRLCGYIIEDGLADSDMKAEIASLADRLEHLKVSVRG